MRGYIDNMRREVFRKDMKGMVREDKRDLVKKGKVGHCRIGEGKTDYDTVI